MSHINGPMVGDQPHIYVGPGRPEFVPMPQVDQRPSIREKALTLAVQATAKGGFPTSTIALGMARDFENYLKGE